jgi:hypothetical protein
MTTEENLWEGTGESSETIICEGCHEPVQELPQEDVMHLRTTDMDEVLPPVRAFECSRCEAIIYSDELMFGRFVPPQFRSPMVSVALPTSESHLSLRTEIITLSASEPSRS